MCCRSETATAAAAALSKIFVWACVLCTPCNTLRAHLSALRSDLQRPLQRRCLPLPPLSIITVSIITMANSSAASAVSAAALAIEASACVGEGGSLRYGAATGRWPCVPLLLMSQWRRRRRRCCRCRPSLGHSMIMAAWHVQCAWRHSA